MVSSWAKNSIPTVGPPGGQPVFSSSYFKGRFPFGRFQREREGKKTSAAASQVSLQSGSVALWLSNPGGTFSSLPLGPSRTNAEGHPCSLEVSGGVGNSAFILLSRYGLKKRQSVQERTQKFSWRADLTRPAPGMEGSLWGRWVRADSHRPSAALGGNTGEKHTQACPPKPQGRQALQPWGHWAGRTDSRRFSLGEVSAPWPFGPSPSLSETRNDRVTCRGPSSQQRCSPGLF